MNRPLVRALSASSGLLALVFIVAGIILGALAGAGLLGAIVGFIVASIVALPLIIAAVRAFREGSS
ncbi:MAG: hypothetical protein J2P48_00210 [Alphaproteobacteria bacterium]|nr:hypothetical protein [Alphaproteobacteria bacterium]